MYIFIVLLFILTIFEKILLTNLKN